MEYYKNQIMNTSSNIQSDHHHHHQTSSPIFDQDRSCGRDMTRINHGIKRFLGVRQRPSGRWVAEIKDSSLKLRLWLGTFDRPEEAAMAYDVAARLLRGRNAKTNFHGGAAINLGFCSQLVRNPRVHQLLLSRHARSRSASGNSDPVEGPEMENRVDSVLDKFESIVEETIFCSSTSTTPAGSDHEDGGASNISGYSSKFCGSAVSSGSCKVYSSVIVAPSFSNVNYSSSITGREKEGDG